MTVLLRRVLQQARSTRRWRGPQGVPWTFHDRSAFLGDGFSQNSRRISVCDRPGRGFRVRHANDLGQRPFVPTHKSYFGTSVGESSNRSNVDLVGPSTVGPCHRQLTCTGAPASRSRRNRSRSRHAEASRPRCRARRCHSLPPWLPRRTRASHPLAREETVQGRSADNRNLRAKMKQASESPTIRTATPGDASPRATTAVGRCPGPVAPPADSRGPGRSRTLRHRSSRAPRRQS